jgi:ankyrin repeat protein
MEDLSGMDLIYAEQGIKDGIMGFPTSNFSFMPPIYVHYLLFPGFIDLEERYGDAGMTLLMIAAMQNPFPDVIALLLEGGARLDARSFDGRTPLLFSAQYNPNPEVTSLLLEAGANLKARDIKGVPVIAKALANDNVKVLEKILNTGADPNTHVNVPELGNASLLVLTATGVIKKNIPEKIALLLDAGADPKHKDSRGRRAIDYAKENPYLKDTPEYWRLHDASF